MPPIDEHERTNEVTITESGTKVDLKLAIGAIVLVAGVIAQWGQAQARMSSLENKMEAERLILEGKIQNEHERVDRQLKVICATARKVNAPVDSECP